jgi:GH25 family lysozyme M1 (1,4-beta-N-acetylmuramidase)
MNWTIDQSRYDALAADGTYKPFNWALSSFVPAIFKASEATYKDPAFNLNWSAARGRPRIAYHFHRSNINAIDQSRIFLSCTAGDFTTQDYYAVDFETPDGMTGSECLASVGSFLYEIRKNVPPERIFIYTYPGFWNGIGGKYAKWAAKYLLWLAQWARDGIFAPAVFSPDRLEAIKADIETNRLLPMTLEPWVKPSIWQFTARADPRFISGYVGIKKVCDYNAVFMSFANVQPLKYCPTCGQVIPN